MSATFTIVNTTFLVPLEDVSVEMGLCELSFNPEYVPSPRCDTDKVSVIPMNEWSHHHLSSDERYGITFGRIFGVRPGDVSYTGADVQVVIKYHWWFVPIGLEKHFRFVAMRQGGGTLRWYSQPID